MDVLNVIVVKHGVVESMVSFPVYDIQLMEETVEEGETEFKRILAEMCVNDEDDVDMHIESGFYANTNQSVNLTWSHFD